MTDRIPKHIDDFVMCNNEICDRKDRCLRYFSLSDVKFDRCIKQGYKNFIDKDVYKLIMDSFE